MRQSKNSIISLRWLRQRICTLIVTLTYVTWIRTSSMQLRVDERMECFHSNRQWQSTSSALKTFTNFVLGRINYLHVNISFMFTKVIIITVFKATIFVSFNLIVSLFSLCNHFRLLILLFLFILIVVSLIFVIFQKGRVVSMISDISTHNINQPVQKRITQHTLWTILSA